MTNISPLLFPFEFKNKIFGYIPCEGGKNDASTGYWRNLCKENNAEFIYIDNSDPEDIKKLALINILLITGGNTFKLAKNIRESGFDKEIKAYFSNSDKVLAGFSAGAIIFTPSIRVAGAYVWGPDENIMGITDMAGLGIVDFEVLPHYRGSYAESATNYEKKYQVSLKRLSDSDYLVLDNWSGLD